MQLKLSTNHDAGRHGRTYRALTQALGVQNKNR